MANPLDSNTPANIHRGMVPGESRLIEGRDKSGNVVKTSVLNRTNRPYAEDLADAYNASLSEGARKMGLHWHVQPSGEMKLDFSDEAQRQNTRQIESRKETDRSRFIQRQLNPVV